MKKGCRSTLLSAAALLAILAVAPLGRARALAPAGTSRSILPVPIVVTPASTDWGFFNDNGTTGDWTAGFVNGPATPPLGVGSVSISLNSASAGIIFGSQKYLGTELASIQALSYSTYTNLSPAAMAFQINYDPDVTTVESTWYGRLVYEPYNNGTVTNGTWQNWDMINGGNGKWWASPNASSPVDDVCSQASPCTWDTLIANWPHIGIRNDSLSMIQFKAGSNWSGFDGQADALSIEIGGVTDTYDFELPSTVYVNASWAGTTPGTDPDGAGPATSFGADSFATIQDGINGVASGGTVNVAAGTYVENLTISNPLTLAGADQATTIIEPAVSDPNCGNNTISASLCSGASNLILVQADNVSIHGFTLDGNNPLLTSGQVFGGADIDARNGIITNHNLGTYNGLEVDHVTVQNIFLRGMYASSGGTFNFHDNTVTNVQATYYSIAMFAYGGGPGTFANNTVSFANDAISANHSKGISFLNNTITDSGSGVHTDNAADGGGVADLIQGNHISDCNLSAGGYGIFVFVPYLAPTVDNNTITNCQFGLSAFGQGAAVTTSFTDNTVTGPSSASGSIGLLVTTDQLGYGSANVAASFTGNVITAFETGVSLNTDASYTNDVTFHTGQISGNTNGVGTSGTGTLTNNFERNWWGDQSGPNTPDNTFGIGDSIVTGIDYSPWCGNTSCLKLFPPFPTITTITSDTPDPSFFGQATTLALTVENGISGAPVPAGTVDVADGLSSLCSSVALDSSGHGTCSAVFLALGKRSPTATFTPTDSGQFMTSDGSTFHTVNRATLGDYNADGTADLAYYRPSTGAWAIKNVLNTTWGGVAGDVPLSGDFNADGMADVAIFRPSTGVWYVKGQFNSTWGTAAGDIPVPGDYNGDGKTDVAIYRPSTGVWYVKGLFNATWGTQPGDIPVPADYNGDGKTEIAIFRPSTGVWYVKGLFNKAWGASGDVPVPADYNGDGHTDLAIFRPSTGTWYVKGLFNAVWGSSTDIPVPADFNGDGSADVTIFRPSTGIWMVKGVSNTVWGASGDYPLPAPDTNADGVPYR